MFFVIFPINHHFFRNLFSRAVTEAGKSRALAPERVTSGKQKTVMKQLLEIMQPPGLIIDRISAMDQAWELKKLAACN